MPRACNLARTSIHFAVAIVKLLHGCKASFIIGTAVVVISSVLGQYILFIRDAFCYLGLHQSEFGSWSQVRSHLRSIRSYPFLEMFGKLMNSGDCIRQLGCNLSGKTGILRTPLLKTPTEVCWWRACARRIVTKQQSTRPTRPCPSRCIVE